MTYFKIGDTDYSIYVNELNIDESANYSAQTNAAGDTVVDYISKKRIIKVGIIPVDAQALTALMAAIDSFQVSISFINPKTSELVTDVKCIIPNTSVEYYTIRTDRTLTKAFKLEFVEL